MSNALSREAALSLLVLVPSLGRLADDAARSWGTISAVQASYLALLLNGPLHGGELAARTGATRAAVAEVVNRLASAGLVSTSAHPTDGRARLVTLSRKGKAELVHFGTVTTRALADVLMKLPVTARRNLRDGARSLAPLLSRGGP